MLHFHDKKLFIFHQISKYLYAGHDHGQKVVVAKTLAAPPRRSMYNGGGTPAIYFRQERVLKEDILH